MPIENHSSLSEIDNEEEEEEGLVCSVGKALDFGSDGLGFDSRGLCCEFYPWER